MIEFLSSDTFRRAIAALVGALLPIVNGFISQKFGITIPPEATVSAIVLLAGYVAQSVVNTIHARSTDAKAADVKTVADAVKVINAPVTP